MFKFPFYSQGLKKKIQLGRAFTLLVKLLNVIDTDWKDTSHSGAERSPGQKKHIIGGSYIV